MSCVVLLELQVKPEKVTDVKAMLKNVWSALRMTPPQVFYEGTMALSTERCRRW